METGIGTGNLYVACRLTSHFLYTDNNHRYTGGGTGFVVQLADNRKAVVTNRHVVDRVWCNSALAGTDLERLDVEAWQNNTTKLQFSLSPQAIRTHPDETIDVAAAIIDQTTATSPNNVAVGYWVPWDYLHDRHQQYGALIEAGELARPRIAMRGGRVRLWWQCPNESMLGRCGFRLCGLTP